MADLKKTVEIIFQGTDNLGDVVGKISKSLSGFESGVETIAEPLAGLADGVLAVDAALAAMAAGGLAYAFAKSMEFEGATVELKKVMGDQPAAIEAAGAAAIALSNQYGQAATDILASTADFKQAGFDVKDAMQLTKDSMDLVIAGSMEASTASELLISALKGFDAPASDARVLMDILNEVSNNYATNVEELGLGIAELSPILSQMGFSFEESAGVLTPVIEVFRSGTESARGLRTGLLNLTSDLPRVADALATIGVSQKDANGEMRGAKDILLDVQHAWSGLTDNQKIYLTQLLAGKDQAAKMAVVFNTLEKQVAVTNTALAATGSISVEVAARLKSAEVIAARFKTGYENLGIAIGDQFRLAAADAIDGATDIENALADMVNQGVFDDVFSRVNDFADEFGDLLSGIADALPEAFDQVDFSDLFSALDNLGGELAEFFGDLDLTDPDDLAVALQGVVDAISGLINITAGMAEQLRPVWDTIVEGIDRMSEMDAESQKAFGNILGAAKLVVLAGVKIAGAMAVIQASGADIGRVYDAVVGSITVAWNALQVAFNQALRLILNVFYKFNDAMASITWGDVGEFFAGHAAGLKSFIDAIDEDSFYQMNELIAGASMAMDGFAGRTSEAVDQVTGLKKSMTEIPPKIETDIIISADSDDAAAVRAMMEAEIPSDRQVTVSPVTDDMSFEQAYNALHAVAPDEKQTRVKPELDGDAARATADDLAASLADEKILEIQAKFDIASIKAGVDRAKILGETVRTSMEWTAKLDIAEVEANAKILESAFGSIDSTMQSTGDTISSLFGLFSEDLDMRAMWAIEDQIRTENDLRAQTFELQKDLTEAQIDYMNAKTEALDSGDININVNGEGLQPHLEAFMWEILSAIRVRANAEGAEFLLGMT